MTWTGDIYRQECGDYRIDTQYSYLGALSILRYRGKILGYAKDVDVAKRKAKAHAAAN